MDYLSFKFGIKIGKGYDHNFVLNEPQQKLHVAAIVEGDQSGIKMKILTDEPELQFYSGNFMQSKNSMKGGRKDDFRTAFALETEHFPDSPNQPSFPTNILTIYFAFFPALTKGSLSYFLMVSKRRQKKRRRTN